MGRRFLWTGFGVVRMVDSGTLFVKMLASKLAYIHTTCNLPPPPSFSCTRTVLHVPLTGTPTYTQKSWGGHPRCDLAPLTTSFGTVGQWERQHVAMAATCPEGEAWAASRNWNHGTHFLWDPRAAPTFRPLTTQRHRVQRSTFHFQLSTVVQSAGSDRARP